MKKILALSLLACIFCHVTGFTQDDVDPANRTYKTYFESKYDNGNIKEQADWKDGLIIGSRKFYNEEGKLVEEHTFLEENIGFKEGIPNEGDGILKTYYPSGAVASEVPIKEFNYRLNGEHSYQLKGHQTIIGVHDGSEKKAYSFYRFVPFSLNENFNKYGTFYSDVFLLHPDRDFKGLTIKVSFFNKEGVLESEGSFYNGLKQGPWKYFHKNSKLKAEIKHHIDGKHSFLKGGEYIGKVKYFDENGQILRVVQYPSTSDKRRVTDTLELYNEAEILIYSYNPFDKATISIGQGMPYEFSGKETYYYDDGNIESTGYVSKTPRTIIPEEDLKQDPCVLIDDKKLGNWYFFNKEGTIIKASKYDFCGKVKLEIDPKEVKKINKSYQSKKELDFALTY